MIDLAALDALYAQAAHVKPWESQFADRHRAWDTAIWREWPAISRALRALRAQPSAEPQCNCRQCLRDRKDTIGGIATESARMIVCNICGNKRCPHATNHRYPCTDSNEPGQPGSAYGGESVPPSAPDDLVREIERALEGWYDGSKEEWPHVLLQRARDRIGEQAFANTSALTCMQGYEARIAELERALAEARQHNTRWEHERIAQVQEQRERADKAEAALAELIACKDIHDEYERDKAWRWQHPNPEIKQEYERRKGPAWAAARAAIARAPEAGP